MTREIGDPLERVAVTGKLGGQSPAPQGTSHQEKRSEGQTSHLPDAQTSGKGARKQHTVYLPPALSKWVKVQAIEEEREISEIVTDALEMYRKLHS